MTDSVRIPEDFQASRGRAIGATPSPVNVNSNNNRANEGLDVVAVEENLNGSALSALKARDVSSPEQFLELASAEGIIGACRWFDDQQGRVGTGLLVSVLREGGKPRYGEQPSRSMLPVTEKLLNAVRGLCLSPDGCRRREAINSFDSAADRRGLSGSELVDQAMGPHWRLTPPHPGLLRVEGRKERYARWVLEGERDRPDVSVVRREGEGLLAYAQRFWRVEQEGER